MEISKYSDFLLEKQLFDLLLEANLVYIEDFRNLLKSMKSPIAKELLDLENKDLKISTNYLSIGDSEDEVKFHSGSKVNKYQIIDNGETYSSFTRLFRARGLEGESYDALPNYTVGRVEYIFEPEEHLNGSNKRIAHFVSNDGKNCIIGMDGLRPIPDGSPQKSFIGRVSRRILKAADKKFSDKELEEFVNEFKFKTSILKNREQLFELVNGELIRHYYNVHRYSTEKLGTLHKSCMRYQRCQKYFGVYTDNPEVCSLLILKSPNNDEEIIGRALVWKLSNGDIFMDRIYYSYESDVRLFIDYAIKNKWCYKAQQNSSESEIICWDDNNTRDGILIVELDNAYFRDYPYMDTLKYIDERKGILCNEELSGSDVIYLDSTEGGRGECSLCNGNETVDCPDCDGQGRVDCGTCYGDIDIECSNCDGYGNVDCDDCDGGETDCQTCDGESKLDCSNCDGHGTIEEDDEELECPDCNGTGKENCSDCDGTGKIECSTCDGAGENKCSDCNGKGSYSCEDCNSGKVDCYNCDGYGSVGCPDCQ